MAGAMNSLTGGLSTGLAGSMWTIAGIQDLQAEMLGENYRFRKAILPEARL